MSLLVFSGLFFPIMIFGIGVYFFKIRNKNLKLMVAFSGAFLLSFSFNALIPHIYAGLSVAAAEAGHVHGPGCPHGHSHGIGSTIGLFILLGFFIQLLLEFMTKGVEHGHVHTECPIDGHEETHVHKASLSFIPVLIGLSLHSFLEAMPLAKGFAQEALQNRLLFGIILHNIPIAIVLMSLLIQGKVSRKLSMVVLTIFALSGPAGVLFSNFVGGILITDMDKFFNYSLAIVVGIFLHISTTILFETEEHHKFNAIKFAVIVVGALAAMIHF